MLRFGRNELDLQRYELRRMGRRLRLPRAPMELLLLLVERRNTLVTRQEIVARLWSHPESIDVVQGINSAINRLRTVLNDDPARPRFIETVIGKGYRFIAEVEEIPDDASSPSIAPGQSPVEAIPPSASVPQVPAAQNKDIPLDRPLSPERQKGTGKPGTAGNLAIACCAATAMILPAVYFYHRTPVPAEQPKLEFTQLTFNDSDDRITASAISPDGKLVAYADSRGILLRVVSSGSEQLLDSPPSFRVDRIGWFADDLRLAVSGYQAFTLRPQIWLVSLTGKATKLLCDGARNGAPSPDGRSFAYTAGRDAAILVGDAAGADARVVVPGAAGVSFPFVFWSADGKRLLFQKKSYAPSRSSISSPKEEIEKQYDWAYESVDAATGAILASASGIRFDSAGSLPDGRMLYLHWDHGHGGPIYSVQQVPTDPVHGKLLAAPTVLATIDGKTAANVSISADGGEIAAVLNKDYSGVSIAALEKGGTRLVGIGKLTHNFQSGYPHAWMPNGGEVLYEAYRGGRFVIYKQSLGSRVVEPFVALPHNAVMPQVVPGGKWILFAVQKNAQGELYSKSVYALYRIPIDGGTPEEVPIGGVLDEFRCPIGSGTSCVLRQTVGHQQLVYYALDPLTGKGVEIGRTGWSPTILGDWDVSPDGSQIALPIHDSSNRKIRLVPLQNTGERKEREISVNTFGGLAGIAWAADGKGFYAGETTDAGSDLVYIDLQGRTSLLRESSASTWGVPSPDGSKLAFVDYRTDSNIWIGTIHPRTGR